jgi:putative transposase
LDYAVTSNHIHLLAFDRGIHGSIAKAMHLASSRVAQEFNFRQERRGAFWEDRYHSTAVEANKHLIRCMTYIDLNMVRAGVVSHPSEWRHGGYREIQGIPNGYCLVDLEDWLEILGIGDVASLRKLHSSEVEREIEIQHNVRQARWSEAVAVGSEDFVNAFQRKVGGKIRRRTIVEFEGVFELREGPRPYISLGTKAKRPQPGQGALLRIYQINKEISWPDPTKNSREARRSDRGGRWRPRRRSVRPCNRPAGSGSPPWPRARPGVCPGP